MKAATQDRQDSWHLDPGETPQVRDRQAAAIITITQWPWFHKTEKEMLEKRKIKVILADDQILYLENPRQVTWKLSEYENFIKWLEATPPLLPSTALPYTCNNQLEKMCVCGRGYPNDHSKIINYKTFRNKSKLCNNYMKEKSKQLREWKAECKVMFLDGKFKM